MRLDETLRRQALRRPQAPAVIVPGATSLCYEALANQSRQIAGLLREAGMAQGSRAALVLPNGPEMLTAFFGAVEVGVAAPLSPALRDTELEARFREQEASVVVTIQGSAAAEAARRLGLGVVVLPENSGGAEFRAKVLLTRAAANPTERREQDDDGAGALLLRTSGTTARPKQFVLTYRNLDTAMQLAARHLELTAADRYLNVMPLYHAHGLMRCLWTIGTGGTILCPPQFDAALFFDWIEDFQPTWYSAVPAIHQAVLAEAPKHRAGMERRRLRFAITNSAPMPPKVGRALEQVLGTPILELYGCSETCSATIEPLPPQTRKPGSVGVPLIGVAVIDESGCPQAAGKIGEIVMRGDTVTAGYPGNEEANQQAFRDGWFRSGDLGSIDAEGFVFVTGRIKEIINRGGEKIAPLEIDAVLLEHPAVAEAAAFGVPHATLGEEVAAVVVLTEGADAEAQEIRAFAAERLSPQKTPREIRIVAEIPKSPAGKVIRHELAAMLDLEFDARRTPRSEQVAAASGIEQTLADIWAEVLGLDQVGATENLFQLGGSSLTAMQISARISDVLEIDLPASVFFEHPTIAELAKVIEETTVLPA